jgi:hypothetical protein
MTRAIAPCINEQTNQPGARSSYKNQLSPLAFENKSSPSSSSLFAKPRIIVDTRTPNRSQPCPSYIAPISSHHDHLEELTLLCTITCYKMAADVAASLVTMTVHDAVPELLRLAVGLSHVAWAVHQDDAPAHVPVPGPGRDLASTARQLNAAIERLGPETSVYDQPSVSASDAPRSPDAVAAACRKVGQDLSLRLELVQAAAVSGDGPISTVDSAALRTRWSFDDVKILRRRLGELIQQWKQTQDHDVSYVEISIPAAR